MANFRARTTASIPGFYDAMRRNLNNRMAVSGGYGPGFDAASMSLAREQARAGSAAALESEGHLQDSIREGRRWGSETGAANERVIFGNQERALQQLIQRRNAARARGDAAAAREFSQQMAILDALRETAGESYGTDYDRLQLAGMGQGLSAANAHMQNNPNRSIWDRIAQVGGAAAGLIPVFSSLGGSKRGSASPAYYDPYMEG
jgi:hypothetical protein